MKVTPQEADFLVLARAIAGLDSPDAVAHILADAHDGFSVSQTGMRIFEDTLAKGCVHALAKLGGWRNLPRDRKAGRLWETTTPNLAFSPYTFELVHWMVTAPLAKTPKFGQTPRTNGDEIVAYLACALCEGSSFEIHLASSLVSLGFPLFATVVERPFDAFVLEALQDDLARRAIEFDRELARSSDHENIARLAQARDRMLAFFFRELEKMDRWDLASFLVEAARQRLADPSKPAKLDPSAPLRDRSAAEQGRVAQLRALERLETVHETARQTPYFEDNYGRAQLLLTRWEPFGPAGFAKARDVVRDAIEL